MGCLHDRVRRDPRLLDILDVAPELLQTPALRSDANQHLLGTGPGRTRHPAGVTRFGYALRLLLVAIPCVEGVWVCR